MSGKTKSETDLFLQNHSSLEKQKVKLIYFLHNHSCLGKQKVKLIYLYIITHVCENKKSETDLFYT